jgi:hypothetical protein
MKSFTSKQVSDLGQKAVLKGDSIEVISYVGRQIGFKYLLPLSLWRKAENAFGNPAWHKRQLIGKYADSRVDSPEQECVRERVIDSQIYAIEQLLKTH